MIFDLEDDIKKTSKQTPLNPNVVFEESQPLKTPVRFSETQHRYGSDYDPDTMDLFEGQYDYMYQTISEELVGQHKPKVEQSLRRELITELIDVLKDLKHQDRNEK